ncbi:transglutaminase family protein [uncultured Jannaschia sp.]|uniref:transglutaminase-like domain-containing protein n=1 Tax=uncultured Jannaschia sp. TaxID=293347 RepID=UPI00261ECC07|nr:transglutaminase family protein [uncultured Jannaschia sp.]
MDLIINAELSYDFDMPSDVLLQVELAHVAGQTVREEALFTTPVTDFRRIPGEQAFGQRAWMRAEGRLDITYKAQVVVDRPDSDFSQLQASPPRSMTAEATSYLMPSRYCPSDEFQAFTAAEFGNLTGGPLIAAMRDWIDRNFSYVSGSSNVATTARETFVQRQGVCRDYAHVMIAFARAAGIPARIASVYAPHVDPPDFHAVAEVWLEDAWHLVDATGMAKPSEIAMIGVGRDAADISFLQSFGIATMVRQQVTVRKA